MMNGVKIRELSRGELELAAQVLGRGMCNNPANIRAFAISDTEQRSRALTRFFAPVLSGLYRRGVVYGAFCDEGMVGVCGIARPGFCQPSIRARCWESPPGICRDQAIVRVLLGFSELPDTSIDGQTAHSMPVANRAAHGPRSRSDCNHALATHRSSSRCGSSIRPASQNASIAARAPFT